MAKLLEITGKAISGEWGQDDDTGTGIPVLRTTNFTNEGFVNYKNVVTRSISKKNIAEKYLRHGDVIIEKSGGSDKQPVGRVIFFEGEENKYLFNNFTGLLRVQNPEEWLPKYVFYALYAYYRNGGTRAFENRTTGLHNLQVDNYVKSVDIPKLSYRKQQHICETLDHVRDAVAYRERQLTKLDELIKARFVEMFGDPVTNPFNWPTVELGQRCEIITGNTPSRAEPENYGTFIEWIKSDNINTPSTFLTPAQEYLSEVGFQKCRFVESGSLLMTCIAGSLNCIGNVAVTNRRVAFNQQINAITPTCDNVLYLYWLMILSKPAIHKTINMALKGILSKSQLSSIKFPFPSIECQNQFAAFVAEVDKSKVEVQKALDQTQLLFDSLMQQYFG